MTEILFENYGYRIDNLSFMVMLSHPAFLWLDQPLRPVSNA